MYFPYRLLKNLLMHIPPSVRHFVKMGIDACIIPASCVLAFWLRFEWVIEARYIQSMLLFMLQVMVSLPLFLLLGAYSEMWVYWSFRDLKRLILIHTGIVAVIFLINSLFHLYPMPRSIYILYWMLAAGFLSTFRLAARLLMLVPSEGENHRKRVLILGAGESAEMLARQILNHPDLKTRIMGFLDDDRQKIKRTIHGLKVFGTIDRLPDVVAEKQIDEIVIAIPSANSNEMQRMVKLCEQVKRPFKTVPGLHELVSGEISYRDVRQVKIGDLLGREPYAIDPGRTEALISGKNVMVTGAAGSIGSELVRQIQRFRPRSIIAIDKDENQLFYLWNEMQHLCRFHPVVMQVQNENKLRHVFETLKPEIIFHAAAYKHVPCMEWYPDEAILNNFEAMVILADMAHEYGVEKFVQISTDKAVYPANMMGVSKRLCELYVKYFTDIGRMGFIVVRFGNVIGSQGSVFTIFEKQIQERKPITVTHPKMERYFMSIVEACRLVLEAAALGEGGCTFLLDMGEPILIVELARQMIMLSGLEPETDVPIIFSKRREGEKISERLWYEHEIREKTVNPKIFKISGNSRLPAAFPRMAAAIIDDARNLRIRAMLKKIGKLVPEYSENPEILTELVHTHRMVG
jgi:FlaA1/EpsC-like NDP-sugar epimerase